VTKIKKRKKRFFSHLWLPAHQHF